MQDDDPRELFEAALAGCLVLVLSAAFLVVFGLVTLVGMYAYAVAT